MLGTPEMKDLLDFIEENKILLQQAATTDDFQLTIDPIRRIIWLFDGCTDCNYKKFDDFVKCKIINTAKEAIGEI